MSNFFGDGGGGAGGGGGSGTVTSVAAGNGLAGGTITTTGTLSLGIESKNAQTSTYQVLAGDFSAYKTITVASGTFTITLVASGSQPANGQYINIINYGSGVVTVARSGQNINGAAANLTLAAGSASLPTGMHIVSDGTNYFAQTYTSASGTVTHTGSLTSNTISKADGAADITDSLLTDDGTTLTYSGTGGFVTSGSGGGSWTATEGTAPSGAASKDILYADSTAHRFKVINNNGTATTPALFTDNLSVFASTTSAQLAGVISDETGSGALTFATSPTLVTPTLGAATATTVNKVTITAPASAATLTIPDGVTLTGPSASGTVATLGNTNTFTGRQDASGAASTSPMKVGTSLPGTCIVGDLYFKSDATAGQNIYECQSTNTWTQQLNSGSGGSGGGLDGWSALSVVSYAITATQFTPFSGGGQDSGTEANVQLAAPAAATIANLKVAMDAAFGASATIAVTLRNGGADTALTCTSSSGGTTCSDTTHSVNVSAGDLLNFKIVAGGTVTNATPSIKIGYSVGTSSVGVTSIATTSPITGGTITTTGTIACATCSVTGNRIDQNNAATTSAQLAGVISDETGSGLLVFATSPTLTTPVIGVATATSINKVAITAPATSATLTIADGKTLTASNTLTFTGTDSSSVAFGTGGTVTYTVASGTKALATSAISSGACSSAQTATATGTLTTDTIMADFNADPTAVTGYSPSANGMLTIIKYPTADTVNFKVCNNTGSSITPGAITLNFRVVR